MKHLAFIFACFCVIIFSACQSKEEKAAKFLKTEMSKSLYDFDSYEPVETFVTEAYNTAYNDSACIMKAMAISYGLDQMSSYMDDATGAEEHMNIWGAPTAYSSTYSDDKYFQYRAERDNNIQEAKFALTVVQYLAQQLEDTVPQFNGKDIIGWEVKHRFRCKANNGMYSVENYRYVITSDFKKILSQVDLNDDDYRHSSKIIDLAIKGELQTSLEQFEQAF